jgi:predicted acetyltransferase
VEYVDRDTARALAPAVFERHRCERPGEISRTDRFWDIDFGIVRYPSWPEPKAGFYVVARDPTGEPVGVARYEFEDTSKGRRATGEVSTQLMITADERGDALLWHHLINLDMAPRVRVPDRPVDDLLPWLLVDSRHAQPVHRADFLWVRPIDVAAMLAARTYPLAGRVVLEIVDSSGLAGGRFALDGGPDGASCVRTDATADLTLDVATLGTVYLSGYPVRTLAAAGLVDEHTAGAVGTADWMFRSPVAPWCSTWF